MVKSVIFDKRIALTSLAIADELEEYKKTVSIGDLIEEQTSTDDAEKSKPFPDIFEAALRKLEGVKASEAVIIGDTCYDIEAAVAAVAAKVKVPGVLTGGWVCAELLRPGASEVYRDAAEILKQYENTILAGKQTWEYYLRVGCLYAIHTRNFY